MTRAAELGAQYATLEEILEQPSPLAERLAQLCEHLVRYVAHFTMVAIYVPLPERPGVLTLAAAAGRRPIPTAVPEAASAAAPDTSLPTTPGAVAGGPALRSADDLAAGPGLWRAVAERGESGLARHLAGSVDGTGRGWVGSQLAAPLLSSGVQLGIVAVDSKHPDPFVADDELFVENLGDLIAVRLALAGVAGRG